jgi:hypothetical protein
MADHPIEKFDDVEEYLRLHLRWKFYGFGGFEVDENDLDPFSKTEITVLRGVGQPNHVAAPLQVKASELQAFSVAAADISVSESSNESTNGTNGASRGIPVALPPVYSDQPYERLPAITNNKQFGLQHDGSYKYGC